MSRHADAATRDRFNEEHEPPDRNTEFYDDVLRGVIDFYRLYPKLPAFMCQHCGQMAASGGDVCGRCKQLPRKFMEIQKPDPDTRESRCISCGCTESRACFPSCWWLAVDQNTRMGICSSCD